MNTPTLSRMTPRVQSSTPGVFIPERFSNQERLSAFEEFSFGDRMGCKGAPRMTSLGATNENYNHAERVLDGTVRCTRLVTSGYTIREGDGPDSVPPKNLYVSVYLSGGAHLRTQTGDQRISTGDVCINLSSNFQLCYSEGEHRRAILPRSLFDAYRKSPRQSIVLRKCDPVTNVMCSAVDGLAAAGRSGDPALIHTMSELMVSLTQTVLDAARNEVSNSGYAHIRDRAVEYIRDNLHRYDLSVAEIATYVEVSRATLYRAFETFGGLKEFIASERVARAKSMLRQGRMDRGHITNVAYALGFSTPEQFNKVFKRVTGLSPTQFVQSGLS